jgi:hypothetical protein
MEHFSRQNKGIIAPNLTGEQSPTETKPEDGITAAFIHLTECSEIKFDMK